MPEFEAVDVRRMIAAILGVSAEGLTADTSIGSIPEWDSLAQLAIVTSLEEACGRRIPEEQMMRLSSVGRMEAYVRGLPLPVEAAAPPTVHEAAPPQSVVGQLLQHAAETPAKAALVFEQSSLTYYQLAEGVRRAAAFFLRQGVCPGDAIALCAEKSPGFFCCYFGAHLAGAVAVPVEPGEARALLGLQLSVRLRVGNLPGAEADYAVVAAEGAEADLPEPAAGAGADIMLTTGTTGSPKGVLLTHGNLAAAVRSINSFVGTHRDDVEVVALPIGRSFGLGRVRCLLAAGATAVLAPGFSRVEALLAMLSGYRATGFAMVPAAWAYLQRMCGDVLVQHAAHLRYIELGSAPLPLEDKRRLMATFPHARLCMHYGLTEASRTAFLEFHAEAEHLDSVGRVVPDAEVSICSAEGAPLPAGQVGEVCIRGPHVMRGYVGSAAEAAFHGAFFRSGDAGFLDAEGYLHVTGRLRDMINVGGKKVSPDEVEAVLNTLPGIADAACVAAPDAQGVLGEVVRAVLVADAAFPMPAVEDIRRYVAAHLEAHKVPAQVEWRESLPRTESGKLQRNLLYVSALQR